MPGGSASHLRARFSLDDKEFQKGIWRINEGVRRAKGIVGGVGIASLGLTAVLAAAAAAIFMPVSKAAQFETAEVGFEMLFKSTEKAHKRVKELFEFAKTTPFELPNVLQASRVLELMTKGALGAGAGLRFVGDVAAATQQPIEELSVWFGRLYNGIASGRLTGEAMMRLQEIGALSGDARNQIEKMIKSGQKGSRVWKVVTEDMAKFGGTMERKSKTWQGLMSNLMDSFGLFMTEMGGPIKDMLTPFLKGAIAVFTELTNKGRAFGQAMVTGYTALWRAWMAIIGGVTNLPKAMELVGAALRLGFLESVVLLRDGMAKVASLWGQMMLSVTQSGIVDRLADGLRFAGNLFWNLMLSGLPRLWDGLKSIPAAFWASWITMQNNTIRFLTDGFMKIVDWFSQGWSKAIWDPISRLASRMASIAGDFGEVMYDFLTGAWQEGRKALGEMWAIASEKFKTPEKAKETADKILGWNGNKPLSWKENFDNAKKMLDFVDPLKGTFDKMQAKGDAGVKDSMQKMKTGIDSVVDTFSKFMGFDLGLDKARDRAVDEFKRLFESLQEPGRQAVARGIARMLGAQPVKTKPVVVPWQPIGSEALAKTLFRNASPTMSSAMKSSGGLTSGGLKTGSLAPSQISAKIDLARQQKDEAKLANQQTQQSILTTLEDLLQLTKMAWN